MRALDWTGMSFQNAKQPPLRGRPRRNGAPPTQHGCPPGITRPGASSAATPFQAQLQIAGAVRYLGSYPSIPAALEVVEAARRLRAIRPELPWPTVRQRLREVGYSIPEGRR